MELNDVIAPPYDVIGPDDLSRLKARSAYNAAHVELATDEGAGDRYERAAGRFDDWLASGVLIADAEPAFYVYRMGYHDESGHARQTAGVIGALELSEPGAGHVLPHERTMGKPKDDRLRLLRACRANLSPVWCLSLAVGLSELCDVAGPPAARCTDDDGVHHRLWPVTQPAAIEAIASVVASQPAVIADGHHRYETALAYRDELRAAGAGAGDHDYLMAYVVELAEDQLAVRPIHRVIADLPDGFDVVAALAPFFAVIDAGPPAHSLPLQMAQAGGLGLVTARGSWLLVPNEHAAGGPAPDSGLLDAALAALPAKAVSFHHSPDDVLAMVAKGEAQAAVLLRPVAVSEIARVARENLRMPEKTTFFHPKPRTGLVFRRLGAT